MMISIITPKSPSKRDFVGRVRYHIRSRVTKPATIWVRDVDLEEGRDNIAAFLRELRREMRGLQPAPTINNYFPYTADLRRERRLIHAELVEIIVRAGTIGLIVNVETIGSPEGMGIRTWDIDIRADRIPAKDAP